MENFNFSELSIKRLEGVDPRLVKLALETLKVSPIDFGIAYMGGFRTTEQQYELWKKKASTKDGINKKSKHQLGLAIDFLPYVQGKPDLTSVHNYYIIIGVFFAVAKQLGLNIRSGTNWDMDTEFITDQSFDDLPHIELI